MAGGVMAQECDRYDGTVTFWRDERTRETTCGRADPMVHIGREFLQTELSKSLVQDIYALREPCPRGRGDWHAVAKERPLPTWTDEDIERRRKALVAVQANQDEDYRQEP